ncbi:MAG: S9 family peptidase, partial [Chitinophagaceae bacterium]|nr:S9 family peptidase [Chitinophagaceae bacterium]
MKQLSLFLVAFTFFILNSGAQSVMVNKANYAMAARFSPKKLEKLIFTTSVDAHWLKKSNRFWYMYETTAGKKWYIVDPIKAEKKPLFDNDDLA